MSVSQAQADEAPSLSTATFNVTGQPYINAMAVDTHGNIYLAGAAYPGFPVTPGALQTQPSAETCLTDTGLAPASGPCATAFAAKVNLSGNRINIVWATFLSGPNTDQATGIKLDAAGDVYLTGSTSAGFPITSHAVYPCTAGGVFAAKLNPQGARLMYSTCLPATEPGDLLSAPPSIAVDPEGDTYITGSTTAAKVFVSKLSPDGSTLLYHSVLGGQSPDLANSIAIDAAGNAYIAGQTYSSNFAVSPDAFQKKLAGMANAFVIKLGPTGNMVFSTYLGGSGSDGARSVQVDSRGNVYVAGQATSLDFPTTAEAWEPRPLIPLSETAPAGPGGFAAKLSPAGDGLVYSSFVFSDLQGVLQMALDGTGGAYLAGVTFAGLPVTASAPQPCFSGGENFFVVHLNPSGALLDRTYAGSANPPAIFAPPPQVPSGIIGVGNSLLLATGMSLVQLRFGNAGYPPPPCLSPAILNAATFTDEGQIAPGELVSLTGIGLGPENGISYQAAPDGSVPRQLAGVRVFFDDLAAPLLYVQSQQINAIAPFELAGQTSTNIRVEYQGVTTSASTAVGVASPGIFRVHPGLSAQPAVVNQDGTLNDAAHPAKVGSVISLYGTGFGQTDPPGITGTLFPMTAAQLQTPAMAPLCIYISYISGCAEILYAGAAPGELAGTDQINVLVPSVPPQSATPPYYVSVTSAVQDPVKLIFYVQP